MNSTPDEQYHDEHFATKGGKGASENLGGRPLKSILNKTTYSPLVTINANIMLRRLLAGVKNDLGAGNMSTTYESSGGTKKPIVDDPQTHGVDRQHDVHARFENTLYEYSFEKKVAFLVVESYILNIWKKYDVQRVMGIKWFLIHSYLLCNGFGRGFGTWSMADSKCSIYLEEVDFKFKVVKRGT
ncbi:hypothetical protein Tco_1561872 [Tanacetum coccineum]